MIPKSDKTFDGMIFHADIQAFPQSIGIQWRAQCFAQRVEALLPEENTQLKVFQSCEEAKVWIEGLAQQRGFRIESIEWHNCPC